MDEERVLIPPVKIGDIVENQEVINSGKKNDGVVKYEGYIIFVNDCQKGDVVTFKIEKILPKFGIGKRVEEDE
jgi:predicted RNA-binding protein with TRAM domain